MGHSRSEMVKDLAQSHIRYVSKSCSELVPGLRFHLKPLVPHTIKRCHPDITHKMEASLVTEDRKDYWLVPALRSCLCPASCADQDKMCGAQGQHRNMHSVPQCLELSGKQMGQLI